MNALSRKNWEVLAKGNAFLNGQVKMCPNKPSRYSWAGGVLEVASENQDHFKRRRRADRNAIQAS
jgi:hypothetical protein